MGKRLEKISKKLKTDMRLPLNSLDNIPKVHVYPP